MPAIYFIHLVVLKLMQFVFMTIFKTEDGLVLVIELTRLL